MHTWLKTTAPDVRLGQFKEPGIEINKQTKGQQRSMSSRIQKTPKRNSYQNFLTMKLSIMLLRKEKSFIQHGIFFFFFFLPIYMYITCKLVFHCSRLYHSKGIHTFRIIFVFIFSPVEAWTVNIIVRKKAQKFLGLRYLAPLSNITQLSGFSMFNL